MSGEVPRRVRVTRSAPTRRRTGPAQGEVSAEVSDLYDRDLRRTLLRWAIGTLTLVAVPLFGFPAVLAAVPPLAESSLAGIGLPWLVLGFAVYPLVWLAARWFVSGAERTERDYLEIVSQAERPRE